MEKVVYLKLVNMIRATKVKDIIYIDASKNYVYIHLKTGEVLKKVSTLYKILIELNNYGELVRIRRNCIINIANIIEIDKGKVKMVNSEFDFEISKKGYGVLKKKLDVIG